MHELMFQAGVKGMSERSELIPCNNTNKTDSQHGADPLPAKERNNHNDTTCYITSHGRQGHSLPQGHPPHTTSKLPLQTNSVLSIVMSTSSKRH